MKKKKKRKKVFVSGCFDLFHSGHLAFLKSAAKFGDLYVSLGSDSTIKKLKNHNPVYNQNERMAIISSLSCVKKVFVGTGSGKLDFLNEIKKIKPDFFIVNEDGASTEKSDLCKNMCIKYVVLKRKPTDGLPARTSTALRKIVQKLFKN